MNRISCEDVEPSSLLNYYLARVSTHGDGYLSIMNIDTRRRCSSGLPVLSCAYRVVTNEGQHLVLEVARVPRVVVGKCDLYDRLEQAYLRSALYVNEFILNAIFFTFIGDGKDRLSRGVQNFTTRVSLRAAFCILFSIRLKPSDGRAHV